tara:strand:- start:229 stop:588 length:360 start_codon:yes stop_codon:yes gene_type:complete
MECLQTLTQAVQRLNEYVIHNDYRHEASEAKIKANESKTDKRFNSQGEDIRAMLKILEARSGMWRAFKKGKWIVGLISAGILTAAGTGVYNYVVKKPIINQYKEVPKAFTKPVTKDLIK